MNTLQSLHNSYTAYKMKTIITDNVNNLMVTGCRKFLTGEGFCKYADFVHSM